MKVSIAEAVDKLTILELKMSRIKDVDKHKNIEIEYEYTKNLLKENYPDVLRSEEFKYLSAYNFFLWNVENNIRKKEANQEFDEDFINLARSVYQLNDKRAEIKKAINLKYSSEFIEEKSYEKYNSVDNGNLPTDQTTMA